MNKEEFIQKLNEATLPEEGKPCKLKAVHFFKNIGLELDNLLEIKKVVVDPAYLTNNPAEHIYNQYKEYIDQLNGNVRFMISTSNAYECKRCFGDHTCRRHRCHQIDCEGTITEDVLSVVKITKR